MLNNCHIYTQEGTNIRHFLGGITIGCVVCIRPVPVILQPI
jgi:hypothetical protein